jgi:hypothetical protein
VATRVEGPGHSNQVNSITSAGEKVFSAGMDDSVREIDTKSNTFTSQAASTSSLPKALAALETTGQVYVATASGIEAIRDGKKVFGLQVNYTPTSISAHAKSKLVAVGGEDNKVYLYKVDTDGKLDAAGTLEKNRTAVTAVSFSPDGSLLAVGDGGGKVLVYDIASKEVRDHFIYRRNDDNNISSTQVTIQHWVFHTSRIQSIAWTPSGKYAASASLDTNVYVWSVAKVSISYSPSPSDRLANWLKYALHRFCSPYPAHPPYCYQSKTSLARYEFCFFFRENADIFCAPPRTHILEVPRAFNGKMRRHSSPRVPTPRCVLSRSNTILHKTTHTTLLPFVAPHRRPTVFAYPYVGQMGIGLDAVVTRGRYRREYIPKCFSSPLRSLPPFSSLVNPGLVNLQTLFESRSIIHWHHALLCKSFCS